MDTIGWGILATGGIAGIFTKDLQVAGLHVAAIGSRTAARAQRFADEHGIPNAHGSWADLVADPAVDVVYVATPHPFHAEAAILALEAGKHVLVEKPFTLNRAEAEAVARAAEERGLVALEAMWTRFLPDMIEVRGHIADGAIGTPQVLVADHTQLLSADPGKRSYAPQLGGGALLDLGIYPISFGVDLFGLPTRADAVAEFTSTGVDRRVSGTLVHEGGEHTVFTAALDAPGPNTAAVIGTTGSIVLDAVWYNAVGFSVLNAARDVVHRSTPSVDGRGMQYQALELERLIREGRTGSPLMPLPQSVGIMGVLDDIRDRIGLVYPGERRDG